MNIIKATIIALTLITFITHEAVSQSPPRPNIIINSEAVMTQVSENPEAFLGKTIMVNGAWIREQDLRRDSNEKSYYTTFRFGDPYSADLGRSEEYGSFIGLHSTGKTGWVIKNEDYQGIKSHLKKSSDFHGKGTFFKANLYFVIKERDPVLSLHKRNGKNPVVGELVWFTPR